MLSKSFKRVFIMQVFFFKNWVNRIFFLDLKSKLSLEITSDEFKDLKIMHLVLAQNIWCEVLWKGQGNLIFENLSIMMKTLPNQEKNQFKLFLIEWQPFMGAIRVLKIIQLMKEILRYLQAWNEFKGNTNEMIISSKKPCDFWNTRK